MANEKRLIDVNEAIEKINCLCVDGNENWIGTDNQSFVDHTEVIDILSDMPTVDAVEVVHARWEFGEVDVLGQSVHCPVCRWGADKVNKAMWLEYPGHKFCGNCGAKMDGGNEDG